MEPLEGMTDEEMQSILHIINAPNTSMNTYIKQVDGDIGHLARGIEYSQLETNERQRHYMELALLCLEVARKHLEAAMESE